MANAFLAQRISSINSIASLCEKTDADVTQVAHAIGKDSRIGSKFLQAGVGFGGSCFKKDILNLVYLCEHYGLNEVAEFWSHVIHINSYQMRHFVHRMVEAMFNSLVDKKIAVLGFAFKPDTGDTREAPAFTISKHLLEEKAHLCITDPHALENAKRDMQEWEDDIDFENDPYLAAKDAHALVLITEWAEYRELDFERIYASMQKPAFVFDGRNHLDHQILFEIGFNVYPVGKQALEHL